MQDEPKGITLQWYQTRLFYFVAIGFVLTILCTLCVIMGGIITCYKSGGEYSKLSCSHVKNIGSCEDITGKKYKVPNNYELPNGSLTIDLIGG